MDGAQTSPSTKPRAVAHALLNAVLLERRPLDGALAGSSAFLSLDERDRALVRHLTATVLRRLGQIDALLAAFIRRPPPPRAASVTNALRLGTADIVFLRTPAHAAVNEAVALLATPAARRYRGFANAILRRLARDGAELSAPQDAARLNTPDWLWQRWAAAYGEAGTRAIAAAHLAEPPLDITTAKAPEAWARWLHAAVLPTGSLRRAPARVDSLPGYRSGGWWVQDAGAALPARALLAGLPGPAADRRIADLCAAPGGKTAQLAAAGARVTALDVSARRLERVSGNLARLGLTAELVAADLRRWTPAEPFDAVLLDAPCSGTGTIRRHPDIARNKTPEDVVRMAGLQHALLEAAARAVRPGGRLVYAVCSLEPEEGPGAVEAFLAAAPGFERLPVAPGEIAGIAPFLTREGDIRTLPCHLAGQGGIDGFYVCRLERRGG